MSTKKKIIIAVIVLVAIGGAAWFFLGKKKAAQSDDTAGQAARYLQRYPDVANDGYYGSHPYQHFQDFGKSEGRIWE